MTKKSFTIIDTDIHERIQYEELLPYLDDPWHHYIKNCNWVQEKHLPYTQPSVAGLDRADAKLPDGGPAGSDLEFMKKQLLDTDNHEYGILTGPLDPSPSSMHGWIEMATALASAYNDCQIEKWLEKDDRLYGSVHVAAQDPITAAQEIDRVGSHPKMVQVLLPIDDYLWGDPYYHPIFEAAERNDLIIAIHHNEPPTHFGRFPRYFIEWHSLIQTAHMTMMVNLVFNGVFEKFPKLKCLMIEAGFTHVPHLMKKMDQQYKELRFEIPWIKRMPSEIIKEHFCFTTQPMEEMTKKELLQYIDQMGTDEMICFSTDYPHWDYDSPHEAMPAGLDDDLLKKIYSENARKMYKKLPVNKEVKNV
jgi:predicted TIM-barrel fold metal-dependent hydrolase